MHYLLSLFDSDHMAGSKGTLVGECSQSVSEGDHEGEEPANPLRAGQQKQRAE